LTAYHNVRKEAYITSWWHFEYNMYEASTLTEIFEGLLAFLEWIGDSPFRLFAALALGILFTIFTFFKREGAAYKLIVVLIAMICTAAIAYFLVVDQSDTRDPTNAVLIKRLNDDCSTEHEKYQVAKDWADSISSSGPDLALGTFVALRSKNGNMSVDVQHKESVSTVTLDLVDLAAYSYSEISPLNLSCELFQDCVETPFGDRQGFSFVTPDLYCRQLLLRAISEKVKALGGDLEFDIGS